MAVYLFFDESGNLDFSPTGTKYYVFGALTTRTPAVFTRELAELRYELMSGGLGLEAFHATEDRYVTRNSVFAILEAIGGFQFDAIVVEKNAVPAQSRESARFYPQYASRLLSAIFGRYSDPAERLILITDRIPVKRQRQAVEKAFKTFVRQQLGDRPFSVLHHSSAGHSALQAVDYCTWAVYRKWQAGDRTAYDRIERFVQSETLVDEVT